MWQMFQWQNHLKKFPCPTIIASIRLILPVLPWHAHLRRKFSSRWPNNKRNPRPKTTLEKRKPQANRPHHASRPSRLALTHPTTLTLTTHPRTIIISTTPHSNLAIARSPTTFKYARARVNASPILRKRSACKLSRPLSSCTRTA